jgi:uncharacterized membrane protein
MIKLVLPYRPVVQRPAAAPPQGVLEQAIGLKWAGWVGAIVLVVGAGLGIKFAYDQGWFGAIPAGARLVLMSLAGFGLIGAGEWVLRRVNRISATGLFGAGVALLFLVSYAGYGFYGLYAWNTAFVLMALATIVGALVARRGRLVSIGVLSLVGGNLAPLLLQSAEPNLAGFFAYLLMLQVVTLVLAWWGGEPKWWTLRGLSLASNVLWMAAVLLSGGAPAQTTAEMVFVLLSAVLYQLELIASAWRTCEAQEGTALQVAGPGVVFSALVTAALTAALLAILHGAGGSVRGAWVLGIAVVVGSVGFALRRGGAREGIAALSLGYRVQAAALLVVAVPVMLSGMSVEIGWCALAVTFAALAWLLDLRVSRFGALITWGLAVAHLQWGVMDPFGGPARHVWLTLAGVGIPAYFFLACMLALAGHVIAELVGRCRSEDDAARKLPWVATVGATLVWVAASVLALPPLGATLSLVVYAWLMLAADLVTPRLAAAVQGAAVLILATAKWVLVDLLAERLSASWSAAQYPAVMNPAMGIGCVIAASLVALFWLRRRQLVEALRRWGMGDDAERGAVLIVSALVIALMAIGISFEVDRFVERRALVGGVAASPWHVPQLRQMLLSMVWSLAACGQLALAWQVEPSPQGRRDWLRHIGWVPTLLAVKFLILDTLVYRFAYSPAAVAVFANLQVICAATVAGALVMIGFLAAEVGEMTKRNVAVSLIVLILLWVGCLEIDRAFERMASSGTMGAGDAQLAKQVALSIYGAVFAIVAVAAGFKFRAAPVRYFGLALFALTLLKVVFVDLAHAGQGYRVLSFLGLGLLLLGTSVLYGKLSPRLLGRAAGT